MHLVSMRIQIATIQIEAEWGSICKEKTHLFSCSNQLRQIEHCRAGEKGLVLHRPESRRGHDGPNL